MAIGDNPNSTWTNAQQVRVYYTDEPLPPFSQIPFTSGIDFRRFPPDIEAQIDSFCDYNPTLQEQCSPSSGGYQFDSGFLTQPRIKLNQFFYPCGAQRYGIFRGVMTGEDYYQLRTRFLENPPTNPSTGVYLPGQQWGWFVIERIDNSAPISPTGTIANAYGTPELGNTQTHHRIPTPMRALRGVRVPAYYGPTDMWVVTLVDDRYYWQDIRWSDCTQAPSNNSGNPTSYASFSGQLASNILNPNSATSVNAINTNIAAGSGTQLTTTVGTYGMYGAYGNACYIDQQALDQATFDTQDSPIIPWIQTSAGATIDTTFSHSGTVFVRDWKGTVRQDTYRKANNDAFNNHTNNSLHCIQGGRLYFAPVGQITQDMMEVIPNNFTYFTGQCYLASNGAGGVIAYNPNLPFGNRYGKRFFRQQLYYQVNMAKGSPYCQISKLQAAQPFGNVNMTDTILWATLTGGESASVVAAANLNNYDVDMIARCTIGNYIESLLCPIEGTYRGVVYWEPDGATDLTYDLSGPAAVTHVRRRPKWYSRHEYYRQILMLSDLPVNNYGYTSSGSNQVLTGVQCSGMNVIGTFGTGTIVNGQFVVIS